MTEPRLVAVGDVSFGDNAVTASFGVDSLLRQRPDLDMFAHVKPILDGHEIAFANLETVLSDRDLDPTRLRSKHMRGRPGYVSQLVDAGFNVVNVANNHILQHGPRAFQETVDLLGSRGITTVGVAGRDGWHCEPARIIARGTEFVFLGYAFERDRYHTGTPLYAQADLSGIASDVRRARTADNVVVCSFHWGREFVTYPSLEQIAIARGVVDAGCHLVLGHHPHVLNGFEQYRGKYIFYSLGNFVFDHLWNEDCRRAMAVHLRLTGNGLDFTGASGVRIGDDYRPLPDEGEEFDERLRRLSADVQGTIAANGAAYEEDFLRLQRRNRYRAWLFLLTHLHRYDPAILRQILAEAVGRRLPGSKPRPANQRSSDQDVPDVSSLTK